MSKGFLTGKVKWFRDNKGYGFIQDEQGTEYFIHFSEIVADEGVFRTLTDGQKVEFQADYGPKGPIAKGVIKVS